MYQVRFITYLLFFPNAAEFWLLVSCAARCYMSWDAAGVQPLRRESWVTTYHMRVNSQSSCFAPLCFVIQTWVSQLLSSKVKRFKFKPCPSRQYESIGK